MNCIRCGLELSGEDNLCNHHFAELDDEWSKSNRIWCNLLHRGIPINRLTKEERFDGEYWVQENVAGGEVENGQATPDSD